MPKTKNSSDKMLPPVSIESRTSDSKSGTLLSELIWHRRFLFMHHLHNLESIEHDVLKG